MSILGSINLSRNKYYPSDFDSLTTQWPILTQCLVKIHFACKSYAKSNVLK